MTRTLGQAAGFLSGGTPRKGVSDFWGGDIPWYSAANMNKRFLGDTEITISQAGLDSGSRIAPKGSTLLLTRGSGLFNHIPICFCDRDVAFNQDVKAICAKPGNDPVFLHFWIESLRPRLKENIGVTGIGAGKFDLDYLKAIPFPDFNEDEQKEIGYWASKFDRKIDLNRRTNETLEAMARALFKDWFVDFGPTRAKTAGRDPYLAPHLWSLFPDRMNDKTGLPEGWEYLGIGNQAEALGGATPSTKEPTYWEPGEHWWATPKDLSGQTDLVLLRTGRKISDDGLAKIASGLLPAGTVLLSSRAPIGYVAISQVPIAINQGFIALRPNEKFGSSYLYFWCKENMEQIVANATGSTFQEISKRNFRPIKSPVPSNGKVLSEFAKIVDPLIERIGAAAKENITLAQTRDLLLPKLMSGEIRVGKVERVA